jgi:hypothetical protein
MKAVARESGNRKKYYYAAAAVLLHLPNSHF